MASQNWFCDQQPQVPSPLPNQRVPAAPPQQVRVLKQNITGKNLSNQYFFYFLDLNLDMIYHCGKFFLFS